VRKLLTALAPPPDFFLAFADGHKGALRVQSLGLRSRARNHEPIWVWNSFLTGRADIVNAT
jgi:hypothetical protein